MRKTLISAMMLLTMFVFVGMVQAQNQHQAQSATDSTAKHGMMHQQMMQGADHGMMKGAKQGMMKGAKQGMMKGAKQGMMNGDMQGMMKDPFHRARMTLYMLPTMGTTLELSDDQLGKLTRMKSKYLEDQKATETELSEKDEALKTLLAEDAPSAERVEKLMVEAATLRARQQAASLRAAGAMKDVLSPEQQSQYAALTPQELHQHMMAGMSMMDMQQMMGGMRCKMMQGGMMKGGMMGMSNPDSDSDSHSSHHGN